MLIIPSLHLLQGCCFLGFSGGYEVGEDLTWPEILSWDRPIVLLQYAPGNMRTDFFVTVLILWFIVVFAVISQWLLQYKPVFVHLVTFRDWEEDDFPIA